MVAVRNDHLIDLVERPVDAYTRVIPDNRPLVSRTVNAGAFVNDIGLVFQRQETVGKTGRKVEHFMVGPGEDFAIPFAKSRRADADINADIENLTPDAFNEFPHGGRVELVVKPAQDPFLRAAVIVLDKDVGKAIGGKAVNIILLHKKAPLIAKNLRLNDQDARNRSGSEREFFHAIIIQYLAPLSNG